MAFRPDSHRPATLARRSAVLDAAIELIGEGGISAVTHRAVAARAAVAVATTSYFFASIDDLLVAAMHRVTDTITEQLRHAATQLDATPALDIPIAIEALTNILLAEPPLSIIAQFETYLHAARRPELRPAVAGTLEAFDDLARLLVARVGVAPEAARTIVALADGFALHRVALRATDHATMMRRAFEAVLNGYGSAPPPSRYGA